MVANFCLLTCALLAAQPPDHSEWLWLPRLSRGQELVYRGSFTEEALGKGVQFSHTYRVENRILVLETPPRGFDVAFYTVLKLRTPRLERGTEPEPTSVRLELARVDLQGRITGDAGVALTVPLDGPATIECGVFVEVPTGRMGGKQPWQVAEVNRPVHVWKILGTELINGTRCLKLEGVQQASDWEKPRGDRASWRRRDVVWLAPHLGVAYKVERTIERKEPAHRDVTQRSLVQYELQSNLQYPGQLFEDRRREILQAHNFYDSVAPLLPNPTKVGARPFEAVLAKITHYLDNQPPTPYREAVLQVKRRVEAARRGESPPLALQEEAVHENAVAVMGQRAPDFIVTNLLTKDSERLHAWIGRPILMVFYSPGSVTANELLTFAQRLQDKHGRQLYVLAFAVSDDTEAIRKQWRELRLGIPILSGKGMRQSYAVEATPKLVILDAEGVVRGSYVGWGPETPETVREEIRRWLSRGDPPK
jgi:hypothetical protein